MSFFQFNKETKTQDLKLSDYNQIWTKFCFLDETGSLSNLTDPFFTVGVIKMSQPYYLMIGVISYDLKVEAGVIKGGDQYKKELLKFFKLNLGAAGFMAGFRNRMFNIFVDTDMRQRLPLNLTTNEKGQSS